MSLYMSSIMFNKVIIIIINISWSANTASARAIISLAIYFNYYLLVSMTLIYFADEETQLRFRADDRDRSECRKRLPNANGSRHRYIIRRTSSFTPSIWIKLSIAILIIATTHKVAVYTIWSGPFLRWLSRSSTKHVKCHNFSKK